jgi:hypothetical protein
LRVGWGPNGQRWSCALKCVGLQFETRTGLQGESRVRPANWGLLFRVAMEFWQGGNACPVVAAGGQGAVRLLDHGAAARPRCGRNGPYRKRPEGTPGACMDAVWGAAVVLDRRDGLLGPVRGRDQRACRRLLTQRVVRGMQSPANASSVLHFVDGPLDGVAVAVVVVSWVRGLGVARPAQLISPPVPSRSGFTVRWRPPAGSVVLRPRRRASPPGSAAPRSAPHRRRNAWPRPCC